MKKNKSIRVLLSPLDWGLGHTTRCIPIIRCLLRNNCSVYVACNSVSKTILEQEFSGLQFLPLGGYNIRYSASKWKFTMKIAIQIPKIIRRIRHERRWLVKAVQEHHIDFVISDNRYGFYSTSVPSFFITHQLQIQTPFRWLTRFVQTLNYRFINRFTECWVPDYEFRPNMAAELSHPRRKPNIPVCYIGPLSRFENSLFSEKKYQWLILLSGPEPQRTVLEKKLLHIIEGLQKPVLFVRGLPNAEQIVQSLPDCTIINHFPTEALQKVISESEYVISRSGYTTVMEILSMQKKAVLIPTPGQTEQEYLAQHLKEQRWCYSIDQEDDLSAHLKKVETFAYLQPDLPQFSPEKFIRKWVEKIKAGE